MDGIVIRLVMLIEFYERLAKEIRGYFTGSGKRR